MQCVMSLGNDSTGTATWKFVAVAVAAVLIGAALSPYVAALTSGLGSGQPAAVAVVHIDGSISDNSVDPVVEDLREVRQNESVEAVVLRVNSPGGSVAATESLYKAVNRTAQQKYLVASVGQMAASGGYFAMLPADRIYVNPASQVGSVGVRSSVPQDLTSNSVISTGPNKLSGFTVDQARAQVRTLKNEFLNTVYTHRGDDLSLSRTELAEARVYLGARATQNGVADDIGDLDTAIAEAAANEDLDNYAVVEKEPQRLSGFAIAIGGEGTGTNQTVVVQQETFGFENVQTPQFLALYGGIEDEEVIVRG